MTDNIEVSYKNHLKITEVNNIKWLHYDFDNMAKNVGTWEEHVFSTINKLLVNYPQKKFVDIGCNIGYHSIRISKLGYKTYSFEPNIDLQKIFLENARINELQNYEFSSNALSSAGKKLYAEDLPFSNNLGNLSLKTNGKYSIDTIEFDSLNIDDIQVIKIDVSGHELHVLYGMVKTLSSNDRPFIILPLEEEVCKRENYNCEMIVNLLESLKYKGIEIESEYPCDHLFYPVEKEEEVKNTFNLKENKTSNKINNNLELDIKKKFNPLENKVYDFQLLCNWTSSEELCKTWNKMKPENCLINIVSYKSDYSIIINKPPENSTFVPEKTMVFRMEPDVEERFSDWFTDKKDFMRFFSFDNYRNNSEWHLDKEYKTLLNEHPDKTEELSTVLSGLYNMEGHKLRVDFVKYLQECDIKIDVYGRDNNSNFKNYMGSLPYHNKNKAILPYKYTFIAENCDLRNYFTEKIIDPILGETLCFYWGCNNLEQYIDSNAFIRLPLEDKEKSKQIILDAINNDEWSKRIECIRKEKRKILEQYSFFNRVEAHYLLSTKLGVNVFGNLTNENLIEFENNCILNDFKINKGNHKHVLHINVEYKIKKGFTDRLSIIYQKLLKEYPNFNKVFIKNINNEDFVECDEMECDMYIKSTNENNKYLLV